MIVGLMGLRKLLDFVFEEDELEALDDPLPPWNLVSPKLRETDCNDNGKVVPDAV